MPELIYLSSDDDEHGSDGGAGGGGGGGGVEVTGVTGDDTHAPVGNTNEDIHVLRLWRCACATSHLSRTARQSHECTQPRFFLFS